jgi:lysophospholipase L1-like esterase
MKTILCYGDSNTWGDPPGSTGRHPYNIRWTGALEHMLGRGYRIVEEGLCGRTTIFEDPKSLNRNGLTFLPVALDSHFPIDVLILMLGTNDLKDCFNASASDIAEGASTLIEVAKNFRPVIEHILLISPPLIVPTHNQEIMQQFSSGFEKSRLLATHYADVATRMGCHFFDAASVAQSSAIDGIHLDAENHALLAQGIFSQFKTIL